MLGDTLHWKIPLLEIGLNKHTHIHIYTHTLEEEGLY